MDGHDDLEYLIAVCETALSSSRLHPKANEFANRLSQELTEHLAICGTQEHVEF